MKPTDQKFSEEELIQFLAEELPKAENDHEKRKKLMDAFYADYRDVKPENKRGAHGIDSANWSIPITSTSADAVIPRIIEGIFDFAQPIEVKAADPAANDLRDNIRQFIQWDTDSHPDFRRAIWNFISAACVVGTGFTKTIFTKEYLFEEEVVTMPMEPQAPSAPQEPLPPQGGPIYDQVGQEALPSVPEGSSPSPVQPEGFPSSPQAGTYIRKSPHLVKYEPETFTVHYRDILWPKGCTSIQDAWDNAWVAVKVRRTKDYLRKMLKAANSPLYKNLDKIKIKELEDRLKNVTNVKDRVNLERTFYRTKKIDLFEVYINWDVDNDEISEKIVCLFHLESKMLLGFEMYPYKHRRNCIVDGKIKENDFDPYGVGIPEMLYDTKGLLDSEFNSRTDRLRFNSNPTILYTDKSGFNPAKHKRELGAHWKMDDISVDHFRLLEVQSAEMDSYRMEDRIRGYAQRRTNVFDSTVGSLETSMPANRTAEGVRTITNEGNIQFRHFMRYIILSIVEIFKQRLALYRQYWVEEVDPDAIPLIQKIIQSPDNPLNDLTLDALQYEYDISLIASTRDKEREMFIAQTIMESCLKIPFMQQFPPKLIENIKDYYRKLGVTNPEDKVPSQEEVMQWQVSVQQQAMMQAKEQQEKQELEEIERDTYKKEKMRLEVLDEIERELGGGPENVAE